MFTTKLIKSSYHIEKKTAIHTLTQIIAFVIAVIHLKPLPWLVWEFDSAKPVNDASKRPLLAVGLAVVSALILF